MLVSILIIVVSLALFLYWFRYTCVLILSAKTSRDYAAEIASANQLRFLETRTHLMKDPKVSLLIIDYGNQQRYLEVRGNAVITPDDDYAFGDKVGAKYGADIRAYDPPGTSRVQSETQ